MCEVHKARDTRLHRTVAIKVPPDYIAQGEVVRDEFEREARSVASLNHPNICSLFDIGDGYMVRKLIEGETLAQRPDYDLMQDALAEWGTSCRLPGRGGSLYPARLHRCDLRLERSTDLFQVVDRSRL